MAKCTAGLLGLVNLFLLCSPAIAENKAVILAYHHIATDTPASTTIAPDVFEQHLDLLEANQFNVWPLTRVLEALDNNESVPPRTVAMTFDDGYKSVYTTVWPSLTKRDLPFTVFVTTGAVDQEMPAYMSWSNLKELAQAGVDLGNHGAAHVHAHDVSRETFRGDLRRAQTRLIAQTGATPRVYAYPYGEFNRELGQIVRVDGLYGVGQQSGVVGNNANFSSAPRFPISPNYADVDSFMLRINAYPLEFEVIEPESRLRRANEPNPRLVVESLNATYSAESLNCFSSTGQALKKSVLSATRFAIRAPGKIGRGRSKYTCTARVPGMDAFAWYSHLWIAR